MILTDLAVVLGPAGSSCVAKGTYAFGVIVLPALAAESPEPPEPLFEVLRELIKGGSVFWDSRTVAACDVVGPTDDAAHDGVRMPLDVSDGGYAPSEGRIWISADQ